MPAEDDDDEAASGPPPDPLDRIWLHPTELSRFEAEALTAGPDRPRPNPWTVGVVSAVAGAVATMAVLFVTGALDRGDNGEISVVADDATAKLAAAAGSGVVAVQVVGGNRGDDEPVSGVSLGGGQVVTSAHVLRGAGEVRVTGSDGISRAATVGGTDPATDLALLLVDAPELPAVTMADDVQVGQTVVALAAGGTDRWVSEGVVSAVDQAVTARSDDVFAGLILTDTAAGKKTRGGALVDSNGNVVGVLTAPPGASTSGLATPIDVVVDVAAQLRATGHALHGWLGVTGGDAGEPAGALVHEVAPNGPADRAGVKTGDVIVAVDGDDVADMAGLTSVVRRRDPGETVPVSVVRDGEAIEVECELGNGEESTASTTAPTEPTEPTVPTTAPTTTAVSTP